MIYTLYLYQNQSNVLLYDKNFQVFSDEKLEMFSSFFSALKSFISGIVSQVSNGLKKIELGEYLVLISFIPEIKADLVIIADKEDKGEINKLNPEIIEIIVNHKNLFVQFDCQAENFKLFDEQLTELIISNKKIVDKSLIENQSDILKSIWAQKGELSKKLQKDLTKKKEDLIQKRLEETNYLKKLKIIEELIKISENLRDDQKFIEYQKEAKYLKDEIRDKKIKLDYYLKKVKESLKERNYKNAYTNLYSFSLKLKNMAKSHLCEKYKQLANVLINKDHIDRVEFSKAVSNILMMKDNIEDYFN
ncbi:MAG: hypothetical protein ACFFAN_10555 [Promethearchaeota archaeon]